MDQPSPNDPTNEQSGTPPTDLSFMGKSLKNDKQAQQRSERFDAKTQTQAESRKPRRQTWTFRLPVGTGLLLCAFGVVLWETGWVPNRPPELADFTPPYTCPKTNAPQSCTIPIKVTVECIDRNILHPSRVSRPLTKIELFNEKKACELLPSWLDQDPRIEIVEHGNEDISLIYRISPLGTKFSAAQVFIEKTNFSITKPLNNRLDEAAYFVEHSLLEIGKLGYLP